jgi:deazaflavin-dependent oxidoreductase (nitroreductase family)
MTGPGDPTVAPTTAADDPTAASMEEDLAAWGKVITLETRGRRTRHPRRVSVGFVETPAGGLLVAASSEQTQWARNLLAHGRCDVEWAGVRRPYRATLLEPEARNAAVRSLILKYGTPAERLGAGPAFELRPLDGVS